MRRESMTSPSPTNFIDLILSYRLLHAQQSENEAEAVLEHRENKGQQQEFP